MRYAFSLLNAFWHSSANSKAFFSVLNNGKHLSVSRETNMLRAATIPFKLCTSLMFLGGVISKMA